MDLPSGKTISDAELHDIIDYWVKNGFVEEHATDIEDSVYDLLESEEYDFDEHDSRAIITVIRETVVDVEGDLKDKYHEIYDKQIAHSHFELKGVL